MKNLYTTIVVLVIVLSLGTRSVEFNETLEAAERIVQLLGKSNARLAAPY